MKRGNTFYKTLVVALLLAIVGLLPVLSGCEENEDNNDTESPTGISTPVPPAGTTTPATPPAVLPEGTLTLPGIEVFFMVSQGGPNPQLSVSKFPFRGARDQRIISIKARGLDIGGNQINILPTWTASDPSMVTASSDKGLQVNITVSREGQSSLRILVGELSRTLVISAFQQDGAFQVEITQ